MTRTFIGSSVKPRHRVTLLPWPAIIPDRIGIIGKTQGVNDRSSPNPRKLAMTSQKLPVFSNPAIWRSSEGCWIDPAAGGESASATDCRGGAGDENAASVIRKWRGAGGGHNPLLLPTRK